MAHLLLRKFIISLAVIFIVLTTTAIYQLTQNLEGLIARGDAFLKVQKVHRAIPFYEGAWYMDMSNAKVILSLLFIYEKINDRHNLNIILDKAWGQISTMDHWSGKDLKELGHRYYHFRHYDRAQVLYQKYLSRENDVKVKRNLVEVLAWQEKYKPAIQSLEGLIRETTRSAENIEFLADLYSWDKQYLKAISYYKQLVQRQTVCTMLFYKYAEALRLSGQDEKAITMYNASLEYEKKQNY